MSDRRFASQPDEILRRLGTQLVPVDEPERVEQRRLQVVHALSRAIRANAEHKRSTRTRMLLGFGLAASLALGVGVAARVGHHPQDSGALGATVAEVHGAVVVTEGGESRVLSHAGPFALRTVGEIETAPDAQAEIRSQKSVLRIAAATKLTVPQATSVEERYRLALGRVDVSVDKDSRLLRSVVVETPNAEVVVHGTVFAVGVSHTDHTVTDVSVTRGSVWVLAGGVQVAVLGPGQHWSSDAQPVVAPAPSREPAAPPPDERAPAQVIHASPRERAIAEAKASALAEESRLFQDAIDARNRGDDARAVELFSHLVQRYPSYEEAEVQLFRAEKRLGRSATAAAEARRYLALHPQGFAHEEARALALSSTAAQSAPLQR
jgi:hypothetical protein